MIEQMPRILAAREFLNSDNGKNVAIVSWSKTKLLPPLVEQLLGKSTSSHIVQVDDDYIFAETLMFPEATPCGNLQPANAHLSRKLILNALSRNYPHEHNSNSFLLMPPLPITPVQAVPSDRVRPVELVREK